MLSSYLNQNSWFKGDIIIIHDNLEEVSKETLAIGFPGIIFHPISAQLKQKLEHLSENIPHIRKKQLQFASLEILALEKYDKVIFCDSDTLFLESISPLLKSKAPLVCCGDGAFYRGNFRRAEDFSETSKSTNYQVLRNTFNSGFMLISSELLSSDNYGRMLTMVEPTRWQNDKTGHTDQMLFNLIFAGQQEIVSASFNYTLLHRNLIYSTTGIALSDAKMLHFNGPAKPWIPNKILQESRKDAAIISTYRKWNEEFVAFLKQQNIQSVITI